MNSIHNRPLNGINKCVRIQADDVFLLADLQVPEESQAIILFAFVGGRTRNNPRSQHTARVLRNRGIGTLLCDLMTEDEEAEDEATEKYRHDANLLAKRLVAVTKWAHHEPDTRELRIGYFGACAGGAAALIAAAKLHDKVGAVVSRGGRMDLATKSLHQVKCPTLLVVGENDTLGIELNREAMQLLRCEKQLKVVAGASHLFGEPGKLEEMSELSGEWFKTHLYSPFSHEVHSK